MQDGPRARALPEHPNLEHLKNEAKQRLRAMKASDPAARLADAQLQVARDYGFPSWRRLKAHVDRQAEGRFGVLLLNDDKTPMEFVVFVLENLFAMPREAATRLMLSVHQHGKGLAGVYDREEAERLAAQVLERAKALGHPLRCIVEPAGRIALGSDGRISRALADGASAADVARILRAEGRTLDPDTAVWVKADGWAGGFGLGFREPTGYPGMMVIPAFFGYVPPGGVDSLPTLEEALGPPPPPPPPSGQMAAISRMVMAGATPVQVATALQAAGVFANDPFAVDLSSAFFARNTRFGPDDVERQLVVLIVTHSEGKGFRGAVIPDTDGYPDKASLPVFPPPLNGLDPKTSSSIDL